MNYKEIPVKNPDSAVLKYWHITTDSAIDEQHNRLFPYGCAEILLPIHGTYHEYSSPEPLTHGEVYLLGPLRSQARITVHGKLNLFGIRIAVGRLPLLLQIDTSTIVQQLVQTPELDYLRELADAVAEVESLEERTKIVQGVIAQHSRIPTAEEQLLFNAIDYIIEYNGKCTVETAAEIAQLNKRGLERKFQHYVGMSPKRFIRMMRLKYVLDSSEQVRDRSRMLRITDIALQAGFYDQAHFIKDFRSWMKETPVAFFQRHTQRLTGSFYRTNDQSQSYNQDKKK